MLPARGLAGLKVVDLSDMKLPDICPLNTEC